MGRDVTTNKKESYARGSSSTSKTQGGARGDCAESPSSVPGPAPFFASTLRSLSRTEAQGRGKVIEAKDIYLRIIRLLTTTTDSHDKYTLRTHLRANSHASCHRCSLIRGHPLPLPFRHGEGSAPLSSSFSDALGRADKCKKIKA